MPELKTLYAVSIKSVTPRIEIIDYPVMTTDEAYIYINLGVDGQPYAVDRQQLYKCRNLFCDTMFGDDKEKLMLSWDKAVKAAAVKAITTFNDMLFPKPDTTPATTAKTTTPRAKAHNGYPSAYPLPWEQLDTLLAIWTAKHFRQDSRVLIQACKECYSEHSDGWYIVISHLEASDRAAVENILSRHDVNHDIQLGVEWPVGDVPPEQTITFSHVTANHIMAEDVLPFENPPFTCGVTRAIATETDVLFISDFTN